METLLAAKATVGLLIETQGTGLKSDLGKNGRNWSLCNMISTTMLGLIICFPKIFYTTLQEPF